MMKEYHSKGMGRSFANLGFSVAVIDSWVHESVSRLAYMESVTFHFTIRKKNPSIDIVRRLA